MCYCESPKTLTTAFVFNDLLAEHLSPESVNSDRGGPPGVGRKPRFEAGMAEKGLAIPSLLARDLRQKQAGIPPGADDESVAPWNDLIRIADRLDRPHHGDLQVDLGELVRAKGGKSRIVESGVRRARGHRLRQRGRCEDGPDAAAQIVIRSAQRHERPSRAPQDFVVVVDVDRKAIAAKLSRDRLSGDQEER